MALVRCRECSKEISTEAVVCPHCGAPDLSKIVYKGWGIDYKTETTIYGYPLIHVAFGRDEKRKLRVAKGVIAIGQFAIGLFTIAQFGIGFLFGFGQFIFGLTAIAHFAFGIYFGLGQFATGYIAIGQFALGYYVLAQMGMGKYLWTTSFKDPSAVEFFRNLKEQLGLKFLKLYVR